MEEYKKKPETLGESGLDFFKTIFKNHNLKNFKIEIEI
jgi:hypothetical protein